MLASEYPAPPGLALATSENDLGMLAEMSLTSNPSRVSPDDVAFASTGNGTVQDAWVAYFVEPARNAKHDPHTVASWALEFATHGDALTWATSMCQYMPEGHVLLVDDDFVGLLAPAGQSEAIRKAVETWAANIRGATGAIVPCPA